MSTFGYLGWKSVGHERSNWARITCIKKNVSLVRCRVYKRSGETATSFSAQHAAQIYLASPLARLHLLHRPWGGRDGGGGEEGGQKAKAVLRVDIVNHLHGEHPHRVLRHLGHLGDLHGWKEEEKTDRAGRTCRHNSSHNTVSEPVISYIHQSNQICSIIAMHWHSLRFGFLLESRTSHGNDMANLILPIYVNTASVMINCGTRTRRRRSLCWKEEKRRRGIMVWGKQGSSSTGWPPQGECLSLT